MTVEKSILLAEDDENDVQLTLTVLEECQLASAVFVVRDGAEALDYLYRRGRFANRNTPQPTVLLLDLKMPKVGGLEVLEAVKNDEKLKAIPVVMLTSSKEEVDLVRSYKLGVNAYVVKPIDFQAFGDVVKNLGVFWTSINAIPERNAIESADKPQDVRRMK